MKMEWKYEWKYEYMKMFAQSINDLVQMIAFDKCRKYKFSLTNRFYFFLSLFLSGRISTIYLCFLFMFFGCSISFTNATMRMCANVVHFFSSHRCFCLWRMCFYLTYQTENRLLFHSESGRERGKKRSYVMWKMMKAKCIWIENINMYTWKIYEQKRK